MKKKDFARAREVLKEALRVPPVETSVYGMLATLTVAEGDVQEAARFERMFLNSARDEGADSSEASHQLSDYYRSYLEHDSAGTASEMVRKRLELLRSP